MSMVHRLLLASLIALLLPSPATAGGWWSFVHMDRSAVAAGQRVKAEAAVIFSSNRAARRAKDGEFYAYALRGLDRAAVGRAMANPHPKGWWSLGDADAVELGRVVLRVGDGNLGRARALFTVPELPVATYALMFCSEGCAQPLANVVPTPGLAVVADPATAQLTERVRRLEARLAAAHRRSLGAARAARRVARTSATNAESELRAFEEQLGALDREVAQAASSPGPPFWASAGWAIAGGLAGAIAVLMLRRRSAKPLPRARERWQPGDDELRARLTSRAPRERV